MPGLVIVGAGECGTRAAFSAREQGYDGAITLIGEETGLPYERPPLSKPSAEGAIHKPICSADALVQARINLRDGVRVADLDPTARTVTLSSGESIRYDRLLLATGARPRTLTCDGARRALTFRTFEDAERIYVAAGQAGNVVIVGGGLIGLELAAELVGRGVSVTVLEYADRPLGRNVPDQLARRIVERHRAEGVTILCGARIARIGAEIVELTDGRSLPAGLVVAAIGVVPDTALAEMAGLSVEDGVAVDDRLQTSDPAIFAAGDCASVDCGPEGHRRFETWQNAQTQGEIAGRNMAGADSRFAPPVWFWSDQFDLGLQGVGTTQGVSSASRPIGDDAEILFYQDATGRLVGAAALGPGQVVAKDIKLAQKLIEAQIAVDAEQLSDPSVNLKKLLRPAKAA